MDIKLVIMDVDGTLTDSSIIYGDSGIEIKVFSTKDGCAIKSLVSLGIKVVFLMGIATHECSIKNAIFIEVPR